MALVTKNDVTQIFAIQAPEIDLPPTFANYPRGWDTARSNNGKPTIKQFNYIQQRTDQNMLWIHQNGAALPYDAAMEYAEGAVVVKDGELQKKQGAAWVSATNKGYNLDYFVSGKSYPLHAEIMLTNGDIAKSTVANNTVDPNVDMTGWVNASKSGQMIDTRMYGLRVNTPYDQTSYIHAAFAANPTCNNFYIPKGKIIANIVYDRIGLVLHGDTYETTFIEPFNLAEPPVSFNKKLYSGIKNIRVQAPQTFTGPRLIDARDMRYMHVENLDVRMTIESGQSHAYGPVLLDQTCPTAEWTGYNKLKNVRFNFGSYGYLSSTDKLNSVLLMDGVVASFCGYFGIKAGRIENSTLINMDCAENGKLYTGGDLDDSLYGGMYIKGNNSVVLGVWYEYNSRDVAEHYSPNNIYITPDSQNITHNFARDMRASNNVRTLKPHFVNNQHINIADKASDDGLGRARMQQIISNGNFEWWNTAVDRPLNWSGYFTNATVTKETVDIPKGYNSGLKFVSGAAGSTGIYETLFDSANPSGSFIKDITRYIGREISCSFLIKNIGTTTNSVRAGISTDATNVYFSNGNFISDIRPNEWVKVLCNRVIDGTETKISVGARVAGIGEGFIVTGFSFNDDIRVTDSMPKPVTENGGVVLGTLDVATFKIQGKNISFVAVRPSVAATKGDIAYNINVTNGTDIGWAYNGSVWVSLGKSIDEDFASSANMSSATSALNTAQKWRGRAVLNTGVGKLYFALGSNPTDIWRASDGSGDITPA